MRAKIPSNSDYAELDAIWRPKWDFIGPVEPPMVKWVRQEGQKQDRRKDRDIQILPVRDDR